MDEVVAILNVIAPDLQTWIAQKVHLRRMPRLRFVADHSFDNAQKMAQLIADLPPTLSEGEEGQEDGAISDETTS